ncbi:hypothetical protein BLGI_943 [Brevibacillus laterosporus GI-9]|nr:hypothetical protein BLGI_943 [Brevibacillus laterosporus GI-9]
MILLMPNKECQALFVKQKVLQQFICWGLFVMSFVVFFMYPKVDFLCISSFKA